MLIQKISYIEIKNKSNFDEEFPAFKEISIKPLNTQGNTIENKQTNEANKKTNANQSINFSRKNEIWYWIFLSINILYTFIVSLTGLYKNESYKVIHVCLLIPLILLSIISMIKSFKKYDYTLRAASIVACVSNIIYIVLSFMVLSGWNDWQWVIWVLLVSLTVLLFIKIFKRK